MPEDLSGLSVLDIGAGYGRVKAFREGVMEGGLGKFFKKAVILL